MRGPGTSLFTIELFLQLGDALAQGGDCCLDFLRGVARGDVLWTIPIVRKDVDNEDAFDRLRFDVGGQNLRD